LQRIGLAPNSNAARLLVGKDVRKFELQIENYNDFLTAFDDIGIFVNAYMEQSKNELNDYLRNYYNDYEVENEYYF